MNDIKTYKVFAYGTLRKGFNNHDIIKGSRFLGEFHTGPGYTKENWGLPVLFEDPKGIGTSGELYEVSELTLELLDRLEGHPYLYERKIIKVINSDNITTAWAYLMPNESMSFYESK